MCEPQCNLKEHTPTHSNALVTRRRDREPVCAVDAPPAAPTHRHRPRLHLIPFPLSTPCPLLLPVGPLPWRPLHQPSGKPSAATARHCLGCAPFLVVASSRSCLSGGGPALLRWPLRGAAAGTSVLPLQEQELDAHHRLCATGRGVPPQRLCGWRAAAAACVPPPPPSPTLPQRTPLVPAAATPVVALPAASSPSWPADVTRQNSKRRSRYLLPLDRTLLPAGAFVPRPTGTRWASSRTLQRLPSRHW